MNVELSPEDISSTVRNEFNFTVGKYKLYGPDGMRTPKYGLFHEGNMEWVGANSVSARYEPHTSEDIIALAESAASIFDNKVKLKCEWVQTMLTTEGQQGSTRDGHYVVMSPTDDYRHAVYGTKDNVFPYVTIKAPFSSSPVIDIGTFRDACTNLAWLRSVHSTTVKVRHTKSLRPKMDRLIKDLRGLWQGWANLKDTIDYMQSREIKVADFLKDIYGEPDKEEGRSATIHKNRTEAIVNRIIDERWRTGRPAFDGTISGWEAFNAVQGYSQHTKSRNGKPTQFDRVLLASSDDAVLKAEKYVLAI